MKNLIADKLKGTAILITSSKGVCWCKDCNKIVYIQHRYCPWCGKKFKLRK